MSSSYINLTDMVASLPMGFSFGFIAVALFVGALCGGALYMSDFAEEFPSYCLSALKVEFAAVAFIHISLLLDGVAPRFELLSSLCCLIVYSLHLLGYPNVSFGSVKTAASAVAFLLCHALWFSYFRSQDTSDIVTLFGFYFVMLWLIPFSLAVSLRCTGDQGLPMSVEKDRFYSIKAPSTPSKSFSSGSLESISMIASPFTGGYISPHKNKNK